MAWSPFKRLWNIIKPLPPAPRSEFEPAEASRFQQLWTSLKPPPPLIPVSDEQRKRRKRRLLGVALVILTGAAGAGLYAYVASAPRRAAAAYQDGMRLLASGHADLAIQRFTDAASISPRLANAYLERGNAHQNLHETDDALADYRRAIEVNPDLSQAHVAIGSIYAGRGDLQAAMREFDIAVGLHANVESLYERGQAHVMLGNYRTAIEDFSNAIADLPDAPYVYRARATAKEKLGDTPGASQDREKAVQIELHSVSKPDRH